MLGAAAARAVESTGAKRAYANGRVSGTGIQLGSRIRVAGRLACRACTVCLQSARQLVLGKVAWQESRQLRAKKRVDGAPATCHARSVALGGKTSCVRHAVACHQSRRARSMRKHVIGAIAEVELAQMIC